MEARELWHDKENSWFEIANVSNDKDLLIRSMYSLVSTGTERVVTTHEITSEVATKMSVPYMRGTLDKSFTYGYSLVGQVVNPGELQGRHVHVMHPHQDQLFVKKEDVLLLPNNIDPKLSTLISNMETSVNAIWDAQIEIGDRVLIQGYGIIGALLACVLQRFPGIDLRIIDINQSKKHFIVNHGFDLSEEDEGDFDVVFNTTTSEQALQKAFRLTRLEGTVVELSWYGNKRVNLDLGTDFHYGRKRLICSQVSHIPIRKQPLWNYQSRKDLVLRLLQEINPEYLLGAEVAFEDTPAFYDQLRSGLIKEISTIINYS